MYHSSPGKLASDVLEMACVGVFLVRKSVSVFAIISLENVVELIGTCSVPMEQTDPFKGPAFDVMDWRSGTTRADSYIRIAEPKSWR